jgi:selenocysteine-specific elongation factor
MAEVPTSERGRGEDAVVDASDGHGAIDVVATAGHVDHGKSSLLVRLTGIDPDRLAEEKRRGLTIDLGFAWCTLPSGREVGFVDVPGHERFIRTMLAGVGSVRLVLFVVAADEGWKPQSEEHLQILDVLGVDAGVIALTKRDLVDDETLEMAADEVRERLEGTALAGAAIVACSSATGEGIDELRAALDAAVASAPVPRRDGRVRLHVDRVFTISGAGTVVTGTLTGGPLHVGDEVTLLPSGVRARVRGLQTHKRRLETAVPVSRVAVNLVGADRSDIARGDVLARPGAWRPTETLDASMSPVRGLAHRLSARGAYKLYAGAAEREARVRIFGSGRLGAGEHGYARIRLAAPLVLGVGDRFVLREAGRDETVAGGAVLDPFPPRRAGADPEARLGARERASDADLPAIVLAERGAIEAAELTRILGASPGGVAGAVSAGGWWIADATLARARAAAVAAAADHHRREPLEPGAPVPAIRGVVATALPPTVRAAADPVLDRLFAEGSLVREGATARLPDHRAAVEARRPELEAVADGVHAGGATPPTIAQLVSAGHARAAVDAAIRDGMIVRIAPDVVVSPAFVDRAVAEIRSAGVDGMTVGELRARLGTSRKYAVPLAEYLDARGLTVRRGDVRIARGVGG